MNVTLVNFDIPKITEITEQAVAQASSLLFSSHKQAGSLFYSFASAITFEESLFFVQR